MAPEPIEPQFDLAAQEARELARRATLAPPDAEGPEPAEPQPEPVTDTDPATSTMEEPSRGLDIDLMQGVESSDAPTSDSEAPQVP